MCPIESQESSIESKIYLIRGEKVMLDRDLAVLYKVTTGRLNEQVNRNRFSSDFMFILSNQELAHLNSQNATSKRVHGGRRSPPLAFTEHGIAMLSAVLKSQKAVDVSIAVMRAFVKLRQDLNSNREFEKKLFDLEAKYDGRFKAVFDVIKEMMSAHTIPRKRIIRLGNDSKN
jgi:hypothetical protein